MWLSFLTKQLPQDQKDRSSLEVYGCLTGVALIFVLARTFILLSCFLRCSERLHDKMVVAILKAPVMFFDSNPVGRILNRFSKDVGWLDEQLPKTFQSAIDTVLLVSASIIIPTVMNPWLFFVLVPLIVAVIYFSTYYLKTSRELMRLASICRSPVFSKISETLDGLDTIRTRGRQIDFVEEFYRWVYYTFYYNYLNKEDTVPRVCHTVPNRGYSKVFTTWILLVVCLKKGLQARAPRSLPLATPLVPTYEKGQE